MLSQLPKRDQRIFGPYNLNNFRTNFTKKRKIIAKTLSNPKFDKITFHTFRHFYATMLYHKTKNLVLVQQKLGHKSIENTQVYTQLITFESDDFHSATARTVEEAQKLVEAGFEYVCDFDDLKLFRKRK